MWTEESICLPWQNTIEYFEDIGIIPVPVLYDGVWDEKRIYQIAKEVEQQGKEGIVVRLADSFNFGAFGQLVAKWVRSNHVQTDEHWMHSAIVPNKMV